MFDTVTTMNNIFNRSFLPQSPANKELLYFRFLPFTLIVVLAIFVMRDAENDQHPGEKGAARRVFRLYSRSVAPSA
jgi:hypothetical protein